jgi:predicted porin
MNIFLNLKPRCTLPKVVLMLAGAMLACAVHADSEVTLYGVADAYGAWQKGDRSELKVDSGGLSGSNVGVRASHDLPHGLKAVAVVEAGIDLKNGTSGADGRTWGRQAYVGLSGELGKLTLGRQYTPTFNALDCDDAFQTGAGSAISSAIVTTVGGTRIDNAIAYELPDMGDYHANLMAAAAESGLGSDRNGSFVSGSVRYAPGKLGVSLTWGRINRLAPADMAVESLLLAGIYDFGSFSLSGGVQGVRHLASGDGTYVNRTEAYAGVHVPMGSGTVWLGGGTGASNGVHDSRATQASAAYLYALDGNTTLYGVLTRLDNGRRTAYTVDTATGTGPSVSPGIAASALQLGGHYRF